MTPARRQSGVYHSGRRDKAQVVESSRNELLLAGEEEEELVKEERERLVHERQGTVTGVLDRHDDLVRELFHLERFVSLLSYVPEDAKKDNSPVFLAYKAPYDLVDHTAAAGPSRTTRRAHTERLQLLKAAPTDTPASVSPRKSKSSSKQESERDMLWTLLAEVKSKGKGPVPSNATLLGNGSSQMWRKGRGKSSDTKAEHSESDDELAGASVSAPIPSKARRRTTMGPPANPSPAKKRKLSASAWADRADDDMSMRRTTPGESISATPRRGRPSRVAQLDQTSSYSNGDAYPLSDHSQTPNVKRVKLIVRRPPPQYSNPRQRPPPPKFERSLDTLLNSYTAPDGQDLDSSALDELVNNDLHIWKKVDRMRRQGRMLYRHDGSSATTSNNKGPERTPDIWDHVIEGVKAYTRPPNGRLVAAQIANRVKVYWEAQAVKDDKARVQEEKRLRTLAKVTIRMVTAKWREAVYHIRDQDKKRREAEERRRGHEHLDAILDQSGQILEAQQFELARKSSTPRSRSGSVSLNLQRWASMSHQSDTDDADSSDEGSDEDGNGADSDDSDSQGVEQEAMDSSFLLGSSSVRSSSRERTHDTPEGVSEGDEVTPLIHHTKRLQNGFSLALNDETPTRSSLSYSPPRSPTLFRRASVYSDVSDKSTKRWPHDVVVGSPLQQEVEIPRPLSARSSVVPESVRHFETGDDDDFAGAAEEAPPDTPLSRAFDLLSTASIQDLDSNEPGEESGSRKKELSAAALPVVQEHVGTPEDDELAEDDVEEDSAIPSYLRPYATTPVVWDSQSKIKPPFLLRGTLRPYQHGGLEWLASLHANNLNGILADEMGLGKTIQTISLLAHLACDRGIWGPHLIIVPTSVLLNWEMEFKKFLPGFKVLSYHGNTKRRKELRQGWNNKYHFNVCVTSYTLASRDAHVFKRKAWYYMILDEAHMIKNFKSQRWNILLMFRSFRRLLLTGTPLQNNLTELWALLQFLMSGTNFANLKEFGDWFSNPLEKAIEMGTALDDENMQRVSKLHTVLRPYLLRRLKRDVEKELPSKYEHLVLCHLSKRQRFLYDEFMARAETRHDLQSGVYQKIANILMQLRKVVNHPDLFEVRPIKTSFAMDKSAIADFEITELLVRRRLLRTSDEDQLNLDFLGLRFIDRQNTSCLAAQETARLDGTAYLPLIEELPDAPPKDTRTIEGYRRYRAYVQQAASAARWQQIAYINKHRCHSEPIISTETINLLRKCYQRLPPLSALDTSRTYMDVTYLPNALVKSYEERADDMSSVLTRFAFATPNVVALDMPSIALAGHEEHIQSLARYIDFDAMLHPISVKLQIAFPDLSLLEFDCGKLQMLARLLRERKAGGHRVLIFTQMTRILDILEIFLNYHGYLYLRLDGATKIEDRQYITERFNTDARVFCFISSSRSGGVGINLTGADTVVFYDSDFNPQMDRQCEDRAHRIGQIRDVHIYRFISQHTVEEALLRKANQKRSLDDIVIQKGEFDWRSLFNDESALTKALGEFEDVEDARAAVVAAQEEIAAVGADEADFEWGGDPSKKAGEIITIDREMKSAETPEVRGTQTPMEDEEPVQEGEEEGVEDEEEGGTVEDYMLAFIRTDLEYFYEWRLPGFKD